jgi:CheY-like chemotaxis protein
MSYPRFTFQQSILFIDDQTKFENLIRAGLFQLPAQYEFCPSRVSVALDRLQVETPDLIVSTLDFREGRVTDFIRSTQGQLASIPAIYLSEPHLADIEAEVALLGKFQVMERQKDPLELLRKMSQVIAENLGKEKPAPLRLKPKKADLHTHDGSDGLGWAEMILKKTK